MPDAAPISHGDLSPLFTLPDLREARVRSEREFLRRKLGEHPGSVSATAEAIGLAPSHLYHKLRARGLDPGPGRRRLGMAFLQVLI